MNETNREVAALALRIALDQVGVMETPLGTNRGPEVDEYNRVAGTHIEQVPGAAWCVSFVYWCHVRASERCGVANPMPRTAYCPYLYDWASTRGKLSRVPEAGDVFLIRREGIHRHAGLVESVDGDYVNTIEGNSNVEGSFEGIGVFRRRRLIASLEFIRFEIDVEEKIRRDL